MNVGKLTFGLVKYDWDNYVYGERVTKWFVIRHQWHPRALVRDIGWCFTEDDGYYVDSASDEAFLGDNKPGLYSTAARSQAELRRRWREHLELAHVRGAGGRQ